MADLKVSNADRVVFPEIGRTKGDVVAYYERIAERALPHLAERPLSIRRYPKGLAGPGFFQKNLPAHYPPSFGRHEVPRSRAATKKHAKAESDVTLYPVLREAAHLPYLANQGAIELHAPTSRIDGFADRFILDLDPPPDGLALVRRAAHLVRELLASFGLPTVPVATGSKGYHVVAALTEEQPSLAETAQKVAALAAARHPDELTIAFRVAHRGRRVFLDWLRNNPMATVVAPFSLRARPRATVAVPLAWDELEAVAPDAFTIADDLAARPDPLLALPPADTAAFASAVDEAFAASGLVLESFDRFRS